ncbi:hypothetical protein [Gaoshiqia sp. Z1-71]|uniref:hypothetical protein n=1 Tax=Gaoshiqia hydrogeniformans TaxID=3290090 RepID=UPI003BF8ED3A
MKTKLFILAIVLCCSCSNENRPITESEKDRVISEVKVLINTIIQTCEKPDPEKLKSIYLDSPDFVSLVGGVYADYDQSIINMNGFLNNVTSQKSIIKSEKYAVLDATTVLYTANSRWETKMKNDSTIVMDPVGMQFLLKKTDNQWRVLSWTEEF